MPTHKIDEDGPVVLPTRRPLRAQTQLAFARTDGTIEPAGPKPIPSNEIISPQRWWASLENTARPAAFDNALKPLAGLQPPCPSVVRAARLFLERRATDSDSKDTRRVRGWLLVHDPTMPLEDLARTLAECVFQDPAACIAADCKVPENSRSRLFGGPPGYEGYLDGGAITNQLVMRPESVVLVSNLEYADHPTLGTIRSFFDHGSTDVVARGGEARELSAVDPLWILATTRSSSRDGKRLFESLRKARPEFDWRWFADVMPDLRCVWTPSGPRA